MPVRCAAVSNQGFRWQEADSFRIGRQMISDEYRYKLLKLLAERPNVSQRELARELGVSLGKANYCLAALIGKGWVKAQNFKNSDNKRAYAYLLTPGGIEEKTLVTLRFLGRKMAEYEALRQEIQNLRHETATEFGRVDDESAYALLDRAKIGERN